MLTDAESKNLWTGETECFIRGQRHIVESRRTIADVALEGLVLTASDWGHRGIEAMLTVRKPKSSALHAAYAFKGGRVEIIK